MREVHTNPQTTSAVCWAIFYIYQQRLCPTPKATKDYISSMVYRIHRKANRVIRVGSFLGFFFSSPPYKMHHSINRKLKKKGNKKTKTHSFLQNPDRDKEATFCSNTQAVHPEALNQELWLLNSVIWVIQNLLPYAISVYSISIIPT